MCGTTCRQLIGELTSSTFLYSDVLNQIDTSKQTYNLCLVKSESFFINIDSFFYYELAIDWIFNICPIEPQTNMRPQGQSIQQDKQRLKHFHDIRIFKNVQGLGIK